MHFNIITKADDPNLIDILNLEVYLEGSWEKSAQYSLSDLDLFSPFGKVVNEKFIIISPFIEGWKLLSSRKISSFNQAVAMSKRISETSDDVYTFYQDAHSDYEVWSKCKNGTVIFIATKDGENIKMKGSINELERKYIVSKNYFTWNLEDLLKEYFFDIRDLYKANKYYIKSSTVGILKTNFEEFDDSLMSEEVINLWDEEYINKNSKSRESLEDELPF